MKSCYFLLLLLGPALFAQTFTEVPGLPGIEGVRLSAVAFADVDGDGDNDLFISGQETSINRISKLYLNDGNGNFTEKAGTPFDPLRLGSAAFADVDGDGDSDLLLTGQWNAGIFIAKLFLNDGSGNFTEKTGTPFMGVKDSSVAFADVDGDGDKDLLITGQNPSGVQRAKLYRNEGGGNFSEDTDAVFDGVINGFVAFADVDGDGDSDLLITGEHYATRITKLYLNDGAGHFTEKTGTSLVGVYYSSAAFADVDGDGDSDLLITGVSPAGVEVANLYLNDGAGNFTQQTGTPMEGVWNGSSTFADVDMDGDSDLLITGWAGVGMIIAKLYLNDGLGNFIEHTDTPFEGTFRGGVAFADLDGDGDSDLLITGEGDSEVRMAKLYRNETPNTSTGSHRLLLPLDFALYPNPVRAGTLSIRLESTKPGPVHIRVYDLQGRLLRQQQEQVFIGRPAITLGVSTLSPGAYVIQLDAGGRRGSRVVWVE